MAEMRSAEIREAFLTTRLAERGEEVERLRAALLNIQALAERGTSIDSAKLAERCRRALVR